MCSRGPLLIIAFAASLQAGAIGDSRVICIGANGHMAIEPERLSCCAREAAQARGGCCGELEEPQGFDPCGSCQDIPLFSASPYRPDDGAPAWAFQGAETFSLSPPGLLPESECEPAQDRLPPRTLSDLRTVFLRR